MNELSDVLKTMPSAPGIYQMLDAKGEVLYVGKAKNLKKRVASYFRAYDTKIKALMRHTSKIEVTITANEKEALLLENNLIKNFLPRYNIIFKDDKSYPYICLSNHKFPRLYVCRGIKKGEGYCFGPYPSVSAVREILPLLNKIFLVRSCNDAFFRYRTRACLQHQIKRCSAPCVNYISEDDYKNNVELLIKFLRGKNKSVIAAIRKKMQLAAKNKQYELAAEYRDQAQNLEKLQLFQRVIKDKGDLDAIALAEKNGTRCLEIVFVRNGAVIGSKAYFPIAPEGTNDADLILTFLEEHYPDFTDQYGVPKKIIINVMVPFSDFHFEFTSSSSFVKVVSLPRDSKSKAWLKFALDNAIAAIERQKASNVDFRERFKSLQRALKLSYLPEKIACFDVSHMQGKETVASCVVFDHSGPLKNYYRHFNIMNVSASDDYGALRQALERYFLRLKREANKMPQILLIDGGKGQLNIARDVLNKLQLLNEISVLAIAKNKVRKGGVDIIYQLVKDKIFILRCSLSAMHLLQQVRDEAHRFAITSHRRKRDKISSSGT